MASNPLNLQELLKYSSVYSVIQTDTEKLAAHAFTAIAAGWLNSYLHISVRSRGTCGQQGIYIQRIPLCWCSSLLDRCQEWRGTHPHLKVDNISVSTGWHKHKSALLFMFENFFRTGIPLKIMLHEWRGTESCKFMKMEPNQTGAPSLISFMKVKHPIRSYFVFQVHLWLNLMCLMISPDSCRMMLSRRTLCSSGRWLGFASPAEVLMLSGLEQPDRVVLPEMSSPTWHCHWPVLLTLTGPPQRVSEGIPYTCGRHCHPPKFNPIRINPLERR